MSLDDYGKHGPNGVTCRCGATKVWASNMPAMLPGGAYVCKVCDAPGSETIESLSLAPRARQDFLELLRKTWDPMAPSTERTYLKAHDVERVWDERDGITVVLYLAEPKVPMTAYFRGTSLVSLADGW